MVTKFIDIDGKWGVLLSYHFDEADYEDMIALMSAFGMRRRDINQAFEILSGYNTGMAVSNDELRMSCIFISHSTSNSQWWSTVVHELKHCSDAIINYYEEQLDGEPSAYTIGYLMQRVVEEMAIPCE